MAIDYKAGQAPKGPSNSNQMASTSGTQQTALQNVGGLNLNPSMPAGPQIQKQQRSSFQQSVTPPAPAPGQGPKPSPAVARQRMPAGQPVVSRGMPMDQGRGYNVFSGMDAGQISDMNRTMGMSNLTALPNMASVAPVKPTMYDPGLVAAEGPMQRQAMSTLKERGKSYTINEDGTVTIVTPNQFGTPSVTVLSGDEFVEKYGKVYPDYPNTDEMNSFIGEVIDAQQTASEPDPVVGEGEPDPTTYEDTVYSMFEDPYSGVEEQLDEKYALQLQSVLAGLDRQAAMMGMLGSPAHTNMINTAISGVLEDMAGQYADLSVLKEDKKLMLAEQIRAMEDPLGNFAGDFQMSNDMFGTIYADVFTTIADFDNQSVRTELNSIVSSIQSRFRDAFLGAENGDQAIQVVNLYEEVSERLYSLLSDIQQKKSDLNIAVALDELFEMTGAPPGFASSQGFGISLQ